MILLEPYLTHEETEVQRKVKWLPEVTQLLNDSGMTESQAV